MSNYTNLDLDIIRKSISDLAAIDEAQDFIMSESVSFNPLEIKKKTLETKEALKLLKENNNVSFDGIFNINNLLEKADKNIMLSGIELKNILVFHNHCERIKKQFSNYSDELSIRDYSDSININKSVFDQIAKCIDNSGEVKDDASDKLRQLNSELNQCEKDLYNRAHSFIDKHMDSFCQGGSLFSLPDKFVI